MNWDKSVLFSLCLISHVLVSTGQDLSPSYSINLAEIESSTNGTVSEVINRSAIQGALKSGVSLGYVSDPLFESQISFVVAEESVVRAPSVMHVIVLEVTLRTLHKGNGRSFSQSTFLLKGAGKNLDGAQISAVRSLQRSSGEISEHYSIAINRINDYFASECTNILSKARQVVSSHGMDTALIALDKIPSGAVSCYQQGLQLADELIEENEKAKCSSFMVGPKAKWSASKTRESAMEVADQLASFYPGLSCDEEIQGMLDEVAAVIEQYDAERAANIKRERERVVKLQDEQIAFERKKYEDALAMQKSQQLADNEYRDSQQLADNTYRDKQQLADNEYRNSKLKSDTALRSQENMVRRDVGVAMAKALGRSDGWMAVFN